MQAIAIENCSLVVREVLRPTLSEGEVLVQVCATSVNRADLLQAAGRYPPPPGASTVLGLECSGTIVAFHDSRVDCGPDLLDGHRFAVGDRVCALLVGGGYAEYAVVPIALLVPLPEEIPLAIGGAVCEVWMTALQLVHTEGGLRAGQSVIVHAAGSSVGKAAIQLAVAGGATTVVATAGTEAKLEVAKRLGATHCVSRHAEGGWIDEMERAGVAAGTVDLILDPVGASYWESNAAAIAVDGTHVLYGLMGGGALSASTPVLASVLRKRITLRGTTLRTRALEYKAELARTMRASVLPAIASGAFEVVVDRTLPLREAQAAHELVCANANNGKIVLLVRAE